MIESKAGTETKTESALELLAKNLDATGKYRLLTDEVKENDMIAFRVLTPDFETSDYIIGLIEKINKTTNAANQIDWDFTLLIMGE